VQSREQSLVIRRLAELAALNASDCLLLLNTFQLALADKPAFSAHGAEDATLHDLLAEALEQLIL